VWILKECARILAEGNLDSGGTVVWILAEGSRILTEGGDSDGRVCGFGRKVMWIVAERCVFLVEEYVDSNGRAWGF
jgi:hypothetical protein